MKLQKREFVQHYLKKCKIEHVVNDDHVLVTGKIPVSSLEVLAAFKYQKGKKEVKKRQITAEAIALKKFVESNLKADKSDDQRMILRRPQQPVIEKPVETKKPQEYKRPPAKYSNPDWYELYSKY